MSLDTLIRGGHVLVDGMGLTECDIGVRDGRIASIVAPGQDMTAAGEVDARHLTIMPGVIDAHVHFGLGSPNDYATESHAAALGGVTCVLNYIQDSRSYHLAFHDEVARGEASSLIDFGLHFILMNDTHLSELPGYIEELGVSSFKYFTNFRGEEGAYLGVQGTDTGFFFDLCRRIAESPDAVLAIHTENIEIVWRLASRLKAEGRDGLVAWDESRPPLVEALDMSTAFMLAAATGCRSYIPHLSSAAGLDAYKAFRARGGSAVIETCPHYLTHTKEADLGALGKVNPPLRTTEDQEALWTGIVDGLIQVVASDHNSRRSERKQAPIWTANAGFPGVPTLLPVLLSEGYHRRGIPLERLSALVSTNPANIFGLAPRKGSIHVGADADFTFVDLDREQVVDFSRFGSNSDYCIYEGWRLKGWPVMTMVRGAIVMNEGAPTVEAGHGRFVPRPVPKTSAGGVSVGAASPPAV